MSLASLQSATQTDTLSRDAGDVYGAPPPACAAISVWQQAMEAPGPRFAEVLRLAYGDEPLLLAERRGLWRRLLATFAQTFGHDGTLFLVAVPSRINWEGHHVDHQGGSYNATTHCREMLLAVRRRDDARVRLVNADPQRFSARELSLPDAQPAGERDNDWSRYVQGAYVALQQRQPNARLVGADIAVASDIPVGASLSSSHALVLGSALAAVAVNGLRLDKRDAVLLVQQGEWFTGSRTGLGDQATMIFGQRGKLFCSPVVERDGIAARYVDLPLGHAHLIIDSFTEHHLQGEERMGYNARVFAYKTAFPLVLAAMVEDGAARPVVAATRRLVDIRPDRFPTEAIYRALRRLPERLTLPQARGLFEQAAQALAPAGVHLRVDEFEQLLATYFGDGPFPAALPLRGVALYGLAECWRSRLYADRIERGDLAGAGRMVDDGHDGDRVSQRDGGRHARVPFEHPVTDALLDDLLRRLADSRPEQRATAALEWQSGEYRASLVELDEIVDLCRENGAISASLTGAGLGGVVTAVIAEEHVPLLRERLFDHFEASEDAELERCDRLARDGRVAVAAVTLVRDLRDAKRATRTSVEPFAAGQAQREALALCSRALGTGHDTALRLLPVDYYRQGIVRNVSVAGAGFLPTP